MSGLNHDAVASQFTEYYYQCFDSNDRERLKPLYRDHSMLTFELTQARGAEEIIQTLVGLNLGNVQHIIATSDAQPVGEGGNILVLVTGSLKIEGSEHAQSFSQCFHLIPDAGSFYVLNDIFKLIYPAC